MELDANQRPDGDRGGGGGHFEGAPWIREGRSELNIKSINAALVQPEFKPVFHTKT